MFGAALDVALMNVQHMKQIAKMARITAAVTLATLKESSPAHQMLSDLMRENKKERLFWAFFFFYKNVLKKTQVSGLQRWPNLPAVPQNDPEAKQTQGVWFVRSEHPSSE